MAAVAEVIAGGSLNLPLQSRLTAVLDATLAQLRNILSLSTRVVAKQHQQHAMPTVCTTPPPQPTPFSVTPALTNLGNINWDCFSPKKLLQPTPWQHVMQLPLGGKRRWTDSSCCTLCAAADEVLIHLLFNCSSAIGASSGGATLWLGSQLTTQLFAMQATNHTKNHKNRCI
jgi:hypothetical protein